MRIIKPRLLAAALSTLGAATLIAPIAASATAPTPSDPAGHISGVVPVHGSAHSNSRPRSGSNNLSYHGGPVLATNQVYVIYWVPSGYSVSTNYESIIDGFFANVAAASGRTTNVYAIDTQYSGIKYSQTWASTSAIADTTPFPASGCTDRVTSVCLTDGQIQAEIKLDLSRFSNVNLATSLVMMLTPQGVGSCDGSSSCAFTQYCAYHGYASTTTGKTFQYANMPDAGTDLSACGSGQYPNGNPAADSEINVLSHEQNEAITDPQLNAWYDQQGYEIGDKCAWNFGPVSGTNGSEYNQTINGAKYYLQQEWSNQVSACALQG